MQFPEGCDFVAASRKPDRMRLVSEGYSNHFDWQRLWEFLIQHRQCEASVLQVREDAGSTFAVFGCARRLDNHPRGILVRLLRYLDVKVAVTLANECRLQIRLPDSE